MTYKNHKEFLMKGKSLLLLLLLAGCAKSNPVSSVDADADAVEVCDGVCAVEGAGDITETACLPQPVSPAEDTTETKIYDALKDIQEKLDELTGD